MMGLIHKLFRKKKLPVTVISGYLGAGKTTLLHHILHNKDGLKAAVIVNDMSELNIDAALIEHESSLSQIDEKLVEMSNGCICCTLREDLLIEVDKIADLKTFDYLFIESTGISEPIPVAQSFTLPAEELQINLKTKTILDTMVTVVDAFNFDNDTHSSDTIGQRKLHGANADDERTIANLLIDQLEFANVIIINKIDLISDLERKRLHAKIRKLNTEASIIETINARVDLRKIVNTRSFDFEKASHAAGWVKELQGEHIPETDEYGIASFVYTERRPFNAERLQQFVQSTLYNTVLRSKGMFWMNNRPDEMLLWNQAGKSFSSQTMNKWWAARPTEEFKTSGFERVVKQDWDARFGDRKNQLVIIGQDMNKEVLRAELDNCLCTEEEICRIEKHKMFVVS